MIQLLNTPSTAEYNTNAAKGLVYVLFIRICSILLVIVIVIGSWSTVDGFSILRSQYKEGFLLNTTQLLKNTTSTYPFDKQTSSSPRSQPSVIAIALSQFPRNLERKHAIYPIWTSINCYIRNNLSWKKKKVKLKVFGLLVLWRNFGILAFLQSFQPWIQRKYQARPWKTQRVWSSTKSPRSTSFPARSHKGDQHPINFPGFVPQNSPSLDTMEPPYPKPTSVFLASLDFKGFLFDDFGWSFCYIGLTRCSVVLTVAGSRGFVTTKVCEAYMEFLVATVQIPLLLWT